ncbi:MAG: DNA-binding protein WhiA, partial [Cyanobacteria bacterium NC_groundwater_1444_Ag_S-0.65um_54_12]|nr:DNA-binding protein WhiA [Cyanobacteria bacterium NC_groundwater_1444_Ag_S-0.65um_54_12]
VEAAGRQITAIEMLRDFGNLATLSQELRQTAHLRLSYPFASLADLAALHEPPLSKSAVNHRIRTLLRLASQL